jgi:glycosyltransferase involved in cell wall biosynthesis
MWLGDDPPVMVLTDFAFHQSLTERPDFWAKMKHQRVLVVLLRSWAIRKAGHVSNWTGYLAEHRKNFSRHRVIYAANAASELPWLEQAGIEAVWCSHNALVDERVFAPDPVGYAGAGCEFDAIYDARFSRFKRHPLASEVKRLALIHYAAPALCEPLWWVAARWRLRHARGINRTKWGFWPRSLSPPEVAAALRRARTGLCLSAEEGAMVASIQYLLCGLPVVTTPSHGGRDVFFDRENSIEVEPNAAAVAGGVRLMIKRNVDPWAIRARALERMAEHRARLFALVEDFQRENGVPLERRLSAEWKIRQGNPFKDRLG